MIEPAAAAFELELTVPSWFKIAACPPPLPLTLKIPGAAITTGSLMGPMVSLASTSTKAKDSAASSNGTAALIWQLEAYSTGAGNPSTRTDGLDPKPDPNRETISPGLTAPFGKLEGKPGIILAELT